MYTRPPLIAVATAAIPGAGTTTLTVIAAPGAGFAIRVVKGTICVNRAAGAVCDCTLRDSSPANIVLANGLNVAGNALLPFDIVEPGYQCAENTALQLLGTSTAGAGTFGASVQYYVDPI